MQVSYKNEMQLIFLQYITRLLDTNWIQRRDDMQNLPSLLDFYFAGAVQVPLAIQEHRRNAVFF